MEGERKTQEMSNITERFLPELPTVLLLLEGDRKGSNQDVKDDFNDGVLIGKEMGILWPKSRVVPARFPIFVVGKVSTERARQNKWDIGDSLNTARK